MFSFFLIFFPHFLMKSQAKTLRLLQHDLAALDHRTSHLEEMPTAGTLLTRELMRWEKVLELGGVARGMT
jgi:hypothetical protein